MAGSEDGIQHLAELAHVLVAEETIDTSLRRVAGLACEVIPAAAASSVSVAENGRVATWTASDAGARRADEAQYDSGAGPCLDAIRRGQAVFVEDVASDPRYPAFGAVACTEGLTSALSIPLRARDRPIGALNLYATDGPFSGEDRLAAERLAPHAAALLANAHAYHRAQELIGHLHKALESRDVIGQAKGIIMAREHCTADEAFAVLRSVSQARNVKLRDVAEQVALTGTWTDCPDRPPTGAGRG